MMIGEQFRWCVGRRVIRVGLHHPVCLDKPPSLAVTLHLVLGLTGGITQRRHFVQHGVI